MFKIDDIIQHRTWKMKYKVIYVCYSCIDVVDLSTREIRTISRARYNFYNKITNKHTNHKLTGIFK